MGDTMVKTGVNTRMPLSQRLAKPNRAQQGTTSAVVPMHNPLESTYDIDYSIDVVQGSGGMTQRVLSRSGENRFMRGGTLGGRNLSYGGATGHASTTEGPFTRSSRDAESHPQPDDAKSEEDVEVRDPLVDSESRDRKHGYKTVSSPSSQWESESHAASRGVQPDQCLDFYASVRKEEQRDDERRGTHVGATQRAVDIRTKRATAPLMCPPTATFRAAEAVEVPLVSAQEKRQIRRNYLDLVECEHTNPDTEQQLGYDRAPERRLPGTGLSWDLPVQSKAITHMATSEDMFRGSPKYLDDRPVGYAGHVPVADRNLLAIHHGEDARRSFAKSYMTLAVHGGGVDATVTSNNLRARHRSGNNAPAPKMLKPKSEEAVQQTVEGKMLHASLHHVADKERTMNVRSDRRAENAL